MTPFQRRCFIALDEWLGIALLLYLHRTHDELFLPVFAVWSISTYLISYPHHWWGKP